MNVARGRARDLLTVIAIVVLLAMLAAHLDAASISLCHSPSEAKNSLRSSAFAAN
jgi:hypothetical protein